MPETLTISPWPDPVLDATGHDPRSRYAETYWLPVLGPTALLLLRHLAGRFELRSGTITLPVAGTSQALGLGQRDGSASPVLRTLDRLEHFELACSDGRGTYAVRRHLPPVPRRLARRLPAALQAELADQSDRPGAAPAGTPTDVARDRAGRVARALIGDGEPLDRVEDALVACGFHPGVAADAARRAWEEHLAATGSERDARCVAPLP